MSHQPERPEKNCLNCGTLVTGRFCQLCGQENIVTRQSFWSLTKHFVYDIFHFDGKFFDTVKYLLFKPGHVPKEYVAGKRMSYLDPIRMYLFTSAVFFLIFFSLTNTRDDIVRVTDDGRSMTKIERLDYASHLYFLQRNGGADSAVTQQLQYLLDTTYRIQLFLPKEPANDSAFLIRLHNRDYLMRVYKIKGENGGIKVGSGWLNQKFEKKWNAYKRKYGDDDQALAADMGNAIVHTFPYILFVSLPFFALILKLLYVRRKQFYYSDHAVFTLYHYIFAFLLLLFYFLITALYDWLGWGFFRVLAALLVLSGFVYLLIAMKRFYRQGWGKTLGKFLLLNALAFVVMSVLMLVFIVLSIFQL